MKRGFVDNVKVRVRTHAPNDVWEREFDHINDAIGFLESMKWVVEQP